MARVKLLHMPFGSINRPNLGLSLLTAALRERGHQCDLLYPNIDFAQQIGVDLYEVVCRNLPPEYLFGEYIFSTVTSGHSPDYIGVLAAADAHVNRSTGGYTTLPDWLIRRVDDLKAEARKFIETLVASRDWSQYDLIGMGSTFHQTSSCLALAREIKRLAPKSKIILGGANCEAGMGVELHQSFDWLDFVCLGEGERLIVELADQLDAGATSFDSIPGLVWRNGSDSTVNSLAPDPIANLDDLPVPDYHDWTEALQGAGLDRIPKALPLETSRGCWYGARNHCIFCGLNGETMAFRTKSSDRILAEISQLGSYGIPAVHAVDSVLDHRYFRTVLPRLKAEEHGLMMFFETRPNLTRRQLGLLRDAGILWIQPGVESLSTDTLALMRKGVHAYQNILLLKFAAEYEIGVLWNILYGIPGESPDSFVAMTELCSLLSHLQAPSIGCHRVRLDRFSPMQANPEQFGLTAIKPFPSYRAVFPLEDESLARMAYFFTCEYSSYDVPEGVVTALKEGVEEWQRAAGQAVLAYVDRPEGTRIFDSRACAREPEYLLTGLEREIFGACDSGIGLENLRSISHGTLPEVEHVLHKLIENKLVVRIDDRFVNIAVAMDHDVPDTLGVNELGSFCLTTHQERMGRMRAQIDRLKIRTEIDVMPAP